MHAFLFSLVSPCDSETDVMLLNTQMSQLDRKPGNERVEEPMPCSLKMQRKLKETK